VRRGVTTTTMTARRTMASAPLASIEARR
jgi:hypothetical protein